NFREKEPPPFQLNQGHPHNKAKYLNKNLALIAKMGGPEIVRDMALKCPSAEAKIEFLLQFDGVGPKYARNIWMDVVDEDVTHHIALDARLRKVARALDMDVSTYPKAEDAFRALAAEANVTMYELDRLLYRGMAKDGDLSWLSDAKEKEQMRAREVRPDTGRKRLKQSKDGTNPNRTLQLLDELERRGFDDSHLKILHHKGTRGESLTSHRKFCEDRMSPFRPFEEGRLDWQVQQRLEFVLREYKALGFDNSEGEETQENFRQLAEASVIVIPFIRR
ncbi:MAG: hypothetical protein WD738_16470, partial [Pirellulales bacterium]